MHAALSRLFRISAQVLVVLVVPGGIVMVLVYQYRRYKQRHSAATQADAANDVRPQDSSR